MKNIYLLLTYLICTNSWADWEFSNISPRGDTFYIDRNTIRREGDFVKMWTMKSCKGICSTQAKKIFSSDKTFVIFNCKNETSAVLSITQYDGQMGTGNSVGTINLQNNIQWEPIIPESLSEYEWKIACGVNR